jgi:flagellar motor switch protein FliM
MEEAIHGGSRTLIAPSGQPLAAYDFRRPRAGIPTPGRDGAIESLHADFAAGLSARLSTHLRGEVEAAFGFVEAIRYDDFLHSLDEITCLSVIAIDPPGAQACLDLDLPIIYPLIDRLLGGDSMSAPPRRPLTQIEQGLALQIIERVAKELGEIWSSVMGYPVAVAEQSLESNPQAMQLMPADEMLHVARFDVRLGASSGRMSLALPMPVIDCLHNPLPRLRSPAEVAADKRNLTRNILDAAVELRAMLAQTKVRLDDLLTLQVGDLITTEKPVVDDEVPLLVEGKEKFAGRLGHVRGSRAVRITHPTSPDSTEPA